MMQNTEKANSPFQQLSVEPQFNLNWEEVEANYTKLQAVLHPDQYPKDSPEVEIADRLFKAVNHSYSILKDPLSRARALLCLKNIPYETFSGETISDPEIMMEALEMKESLDEAVTNNEKKALIVTLQKTQKEIERAFDQDFSSDNAQNLLKLYARLSFVVKTKLEAMKLLPHTTF